MRSMPNYSMQIGKLESYNRMKKAAAVSSGCRFFYVYRFYKLYFLQALSLL